MLGKNEFFWKKQMKIQLQINAYLLQRIQVYSISNVVLLFEIILFFQELDAFYDKTTNVIECGGVQIEGLVLRSILPAPIRNDALLKKYYFLPFNNKEHVRITLPNWFTNSVAQLGFAPLFHVHLSPIILYDSWTLTPIHFSSV